MKITSRNIVDTIVGHASNCELRKMPLTMCTAMVHHPEQYGLNRMWKCTCGKDDTAVFGPNFVPPKYS